MNTEAESTTTPAVKTEVKEVGPCKLSIKVEVPQAMVAAKLDEKFRSLGSSVALPGFRKGKVPRPILEKRFGKEVVQEAKGELMRDTFEKVVQEKSIAVLGDPEVDVDAVAFSVDQPLAFEVQVEIRPTITLGNYKGLETKKFVHPVEDKDVEAGIQEIRERQGEMIAIEGAPAQQDDTIICDEEFFVEGRPPMKNENVEIFLDGETLTVFGQPMADLAKALIGSAIGSAHEREIQVPADHADEGLRGKTGKVRLTVQEIKRLRLPEVNEEWAKTLDFESLDEMKSEVRKRLGLAREEASRRGMEEQIVDQLVKAHEFPLPEGMVARAHQDLLNRRHVELEMAGVPHEKIHEHIDKVKESAKEAVIQGLRAQLLLDEIGKKERIYVTQPEVEARLEEIARKHKRWPHEIREHYEKHGLMAPLRAQLREEKVRGLLLSQAKVTEAPPPTPEGGA